MASLLSSKYASPVMDKATLRNRLRRAIIESLERRELMANDVLKGSFAPNTTAAYRDAWELAANQARGISNNTDTAPFRWTNPVGGPSVNVGDPATITWSIVQDGSLDAGDSNKVSNLVTFMDGIYGSGSGAISARPWFQLFQRAFDRWAADTGITFVYQAESTQMDFGASGNRGVTGVRGDIRIGGHSIDGDFGAVSYGYYPQFGGNAGFDGDLILDTTDRFFRDNANPVSGANTALVNTLIRSIGTAIGLGTVGPENGTKLMEPNVSLTLAGSQPDDVLRGQRLYGDDKELNNTLATATDLGIVGSGTITTASVTNVSINGSGDFDWFKLRTEGAGRITVTLTPVGAQYSVGLINTTATAVDTLRFGDLKLQLLSADGTIISSIDNAGLGLGESITDLQLPSGGQYFIRVSGTGTQPQMYNLNVNVAGVLANSTGTGPRLLSVAPNSGEIFTFNGVNTLTTAPTELVLRFDGSGDLNAATLANGIKVTRAGRDGVFGDIKDVTITPGFNGFGDNARIVVIRFADTLVDDLYRIEIIGEADGSTVTNPSAIRNTLGRALTPRIVGTDRDTYTFRLSLGAQVVAVVPQPVTRNADGSLNPQYDTIQVYFNDDDLNTASATNPNFYQLVFTSDSVTPADDVRFTPSSVVYDSVNDVATLKFSSRIDQLAGPGTYRLRVGSSTQVNTALNLPSVAVLNPSDPSDFFSNAISLDASLTAGAGSVKVNEQLVNTGVPLPLDFMGSDLDPGSRDINDTLISKDDNHVGNTGDQSSRIQKLTYSFMQNVPYGNDAQNRPVFTTITADQVARVREVMELYSQQLGIDFSEVDGSNANLKIVVGDLWPNGVTTGVTSRPGAELGLANPATGLAIMDGAETWDNGFGGNFFGTVLHEVGHLLGLGHSYDLPPGTTMGSYDNVGIDGSLGSQSNQQFPGNNDVIHGQFLYRPDNKDVDLYRFTVGANQTKSLRAETIAERLADSSDADTVLTLYMQTPTGLVVIGRNNDYFSSDSFLTMDLNGGPSGTTYFLAVTTAGNQDFSPTVPGSGSGGVSEGKYQLVVDLVDKTNVSLVDTDNTPIDGDGDGTAGGDFNFWFRSAAPTGVAAPGEPKIVFVDKGYAGASTGSPAQPFNSLPAALPFLNSGDILRVVGSTGFDKDVKTVTDNPAYELGRGGPGNVILSDGISFQVPQGVTMMIDAGAIFKLRGSRISAGSISSGTDNSFSSIQVLGTPALPVYFTSYNDESKGTDTNPITTTAQAGDWGGIELHNDIDRAQGRGDYERKGIFLNYVGWADMQFGGGQITVATPSPTVNPIYMAESRPTILKNIIRNSADAAISADPDSFEETRFTEPRYQLPRNSTDTGFRPDYERVGPDIRGNTLRLNSVNGLFVRVPTVAGQEITSLNVAARFDDNDIVHVFGENLLIGGTPGGAFLERTGPAVTLTLGTAGNTTGATLATGAYQYKVTFVDRFGGEGVPSAAINASVTAGNNSITLTNLPIATGDFVGRRVWRMGPSDTTFKLVAELDRSSTAYADTGKSLNVDGGLLNAFQIQRARQDARLAIDPGIIVKSLGSRIEVGIGAQLIAEGTASQPIIFTTRTDDRYGAGGEFDTNNDRSATPRSRGDWSGLVARHLASMSIDHALIAFAGGNSSVPGGFAGFNPVEFHQAQGRVANSVIENADTGVGGNLAATRGGRGTNAAAAIFVDASEPIIIDNVIRNNLGAAININADSLNSVAQQDSGRQTGAVDIRPGGLSNVGPLVRGNRLAANSTNGMQVRGGTLTTESVWDDTDIVHVLQDEIVVPNFHHVGGLRLISHVDESLVVKLEGANAGFTASGRLLDINDRIGGSIQIEGAPGFPVVLTSLRDDSVGSGLDPTGKPQFDTNNNGAANAGAPGNWRSIRFDELSNDRNVATAPELEADQIADRGTNDEPSAAQSLGGLASGIGFGDENLRLGFTVNGSIAAPQDLDVYSFVGTAGTMVWIDIDRTGSSLDSVVELVTDTGVILAQSDNSLFESQAVANGQPSTLYQNPNVALIAPNQTQVMEQDPLAVQNSWISGAARDLGSINTRDAGFRVALPGTAGTSNTYYLRVRSSNIGQGDPQSKLQDLTQVRNGQTTGAYRLQVRLQQTDEVAGSSLHYADVRFATNGLEALATPVHSPLLSSNAIAAANTNTTSLPLGDLGRSDRGALSAAGQLNNIGDVVWFDFSIRRNDTQLIQPAGGTLPIAPTHVSTVFDVDYADGYGGPNTNIWVYSRATGQLVYMGTDSNVLDDRAAPTQGSDQDDLTRGSAGSRDPFIGAQALPVGDYLVAVSNNSQLAGAMAQFQVRNATVGGANATLTRLEPIESVRRVVEDRIETFTVPNTLVSTAAGALQVAFGPNQAAVTNNNMVPYTMADIVSYTISDTNNTTSRLKNLNLYTGILEEDVSDNANSRLRDLAMAPDGRLVGYHIPVNTGVNTVTDANSGNLQQLNIQGTGGAVTPLGNSGLQTFTTQQTAGGANPTFAIQQRSHTGFNPVNSVGDGIQFNGLTFFSNNANTGSSLFLYGVGSRGNGQTSFFFPTFDANGGVNGIDTTRTNYNTTNIVYLLDPTTGAAQNAAGAQTRTANARVNGAGTNQVELGRFLSGNAATQYTTGTVTGLARLGNNLYAVSDLGEFFVTSVGANGNNTLSGQINSANAAEVYSGVLPLLTITDPQLGTAVSFQGLAAGTPNMVDANGNSMANTLFGITGNGVIYAFNTAGVLQNVFPGGTYKTSSTSNPIGQSFGIAFSPLDVNLWHVTGTRFNDAGHGFPATFNRSRPGSIIGNNSLLFGFENAGTTTARQNGIWSDRQSVFNGTTNLPGGAKGAIESQPINLSAYGADDLPTLYFNYYLSTENRNADNPNDATFMRDSFRVYGTADGTNWVLMATNNTSNSGRTPPNTFTDNFDEYDNNSSAASYTDAFGNKIVVQELYDVNDPGVANQDTGGTAPDAWRQARINLAPFAGQQNVRLRFEYASGATFNTGNSLIGGIELTAIPAWNINDGDNFTVATVDQATALTRTFEFDLGLVLNMPSASSIPEGSQLRIDGRTYTFTFTSTVAPDTINLTAGATPAQVAQTVLGQLFADGYATAYINAVQSNVIIIPTNTTTVRSVAGGGVYSTTIPGPSDIIKQRPGVVAGRTSIPILANQAAYNTSAVSVRNAMRTALAAQFSGGSTNTWTVYGQTIRLLKYDVTNINMVNQLGITRARSGDAFGVNNTATGTLGAGVAERGQANTGQGVFIDDIIIGFAERGEQVFNAPSASNFFPNTDYEPRGFNFDENEQGRFQLEIRTGLDYGISYEHDSLAVPPPSNYLLQTTIDTNDRIGSATRLTAPSGSQIADGSTFTLSDGTNVVTFEFDVTSGTLDTLSAGTQPGNVAIAITSDMRPGNVARAIRNAINSQTTVKIYASVLGEMINSNNALDSSNSSTVILHGTAASTRTGVSIPAGSPLTMTFSGADVAAQENLGDRNRGTVDQGQLIVSSVSFSNASQFGVRLDDTNNPTAPRNLATSNPSRLTTGAVLINNVFNSNRQGGVNITADAASAADPVVNAPIVRIINNTFYGVRNGDTLVNVTGGATPTILNNIFVNAATGIAVDAASSSTVIGANYFQNNINPGPLGTFPINIATGDPFENAAAGNFYLKALSQAIDSSLEALPERSTISQIRTAIGLPPSPMLAPDRDIFGQRRVDDPTVSTPAGLGGNVFKDRGALDRADFVAPTAVLLQPQDNDSAGVDIDRTITYVRQGSGLLNFFSLLIQDGDGIGPDNSTLDDTVNTAAANNIRLTENGRLLTPGTDYVYGYNANSRTVTLTPLAGIWRSDSVYEITLNNRNGFQITAGTGASINAGDTLTVGTSVFTFRKTASTVATDIVIGANDSAYLVATKILEKINAIGGAVSAYLQGNSGQLVVLGASTVTSSRAASAAITTTQGIRDLAQNFLSPNRANTLTQFTIVMPNVQLDYGDTSATPTVQAVNGARHALLPADAPRLVLGQFVDSDADGLPTQSATGDDNESSVDLLTLGSSGGVTVGRAGPASLLMPAGSAAGLDGQQIVITDPLLKSVVVEFNTDATPSSASVVSVNVNTTDTAAQVAAKFVTALNTAILAGRVNGLTPIASGAVVTTGGTAAHQFNVTGAPAVQRQLVGNVQLVMPNTVTTAMDGLTFRITDGTGRSVTFELNDTSAVNPPAAATNVAVNLNLATSTPALLALALSNAINGQAALGNLAVGLTSLDGATITIRGNDEDGVSFGRVFNANSKDTPILIQSTTTGVVDAWIDWNGDGDFIDAGEQILKSRSVTFGTNEFLITTPVTATIGTTTARFRLSALGGGLQPSSLAIGGEVEDYMIEIVAGRPPVGVADTAYALDEDQVLTVSAAAGVLANDTDPDGSPLRVFDPDPTTPTVEPEVAPINGTLVLNTDGSFVYTPNLDFYGTDTFAYFVTDPRLIASNATTVTITVNPINDDPFAFDDTITILEDEPITRAGSVFWANDWRHFRNNPNELAQTLELVDAQIISPAGGTVSVVNDTLVYTPLLNYNNAINGPAKILLTIKDGGAAGAGTGTATTRRTSTSMLTVNITPVNDRPEFVTPVSTSTDEDAGVVTVPNFITGIRPGPTDAFDEATGPALQFEDQKVSFQVRPLIPGLFAQAPAIAPNGTLTYRLAPDVNRILQVPGTPGFPQILVEVIGVDTGSSAATSNPSIRNLNASLPVTFTILPTEINDAPEFTIPPGTTSDEDFGLVLRPGFMTGIRPGPTTALDETNQTLRVDLSFDPNAFSQAPAIDLATGNLTYVTAQHINSFTGQSLVVTVTVTDSGRNDAPNVNFTVKSFSITVNPINDAPEFTLPTPPITNTTEDSGDVTVAGFVTGIRPGPIAAVDEGPLREDQKVTFRVRPLNAAQFATRPAIDPTGTLTYKLAPDINVVTPFTPILVEVIADDTGLGTPAPNVRTSAPQTFTILPSEINDAPEFTIPPGTTSDEDFGLVLRPGFMTNIRKGPTTALDEVVQTLRVDLSFDPNAFSQAPAIDLITGNLTYVTAQHVNSFTGQSLVVTVTVTDSGRNDAPNVNFTVKSFSITVNPINDAPEFTLPTPPVTTTLEDSGDVTVPNYVTDIRPGPIAAVDEGPLREDQKVSFRVRALNAAQFATLPLIDPTGQLTYKLAPDINVVTPFTPILVEVIADDTGLGTPAPNVRTSAPKTFTILPTAINDAPEFTIPTSVTSIEDEGVVTRAFATNIRKGPTTALDEVVQTLTVTFGFDPNAFSQAPALDLATGRLTYATAPNVNNFTGQNLVVTITLTDDGSNVAPNVNFTTKTFTIDVTPINDPPEYTMPATTDTVEDGGDIVTNPFITGIRPGPINAIDEQNREGQTVSFQVRAITPSQFVTLPAIDANGVLTYKLAPDINVVTPFPAILVEVIAVDTGANTPPPNNNRAAPRTFTILPAAINDAPEYTIPTSITSLEDAGVVSVPNFATNIRKGPTTALDEVVQTLTATFTFDPNAFSQAPALDVNTGRLTYATALNVNSFTGQNLVVTMTLTDSGRNDAPHVNATVKSFTINVTEVNDAPEFTMPASTTTSEDAGDVTVDSFLTAIRPGPINAIDEGPARENQTVSFQVRALNTALFATQPAIDPTGKLTYKLAADVNQVTPFPAVLVEVIAVDTGLASPAPNVNRSLPVTFTIIPTAINDAPEFTLPATATALEDAGLVTINNFMTGIRPGPVTALDEVVQTLSITVTGSAATFLTAPTINLATGTLQFQTAADVNNLTQNDLVVTVTVTDSGSGVAPNVNSTTKTFLLNITPVNDVPRFTLPATSVSVFEDNEEVIGQPLTQFTSFATGIAAGPATAVDETTITATKQTLNFVTTFVSNPSLFETAGQPRITPAGVLEFDSATDKNGTSVVVVRLVDSGAGTAPDVNTSPTQTFTITVRPVNDAPEFTLPATHVSNEDQGLIIVPGFATNLRPGTVTSTDESGQTFTVTVTALDPASFVVQPTIGADGTLVYRTAPDINSSSPGRDLRVTVRLTDDGVAGPLPDNNTSVTKTFTVVPTPINDAPLFTLPTNQVTVIEDVEQFLGTSISSFPGFATNILTGPPTATDEVTQNVAFEILDVSAPELFSTQPAISPTGELTFKTAQHKNGKAVVITRLVDSGSSVSPNVNASGRQTFTISLTPINDAPLFDIPAGLTVDEDAGQFSRGAFATNVRRGPVGAEDENSQTVSFIVTAVQPSAFAVQPTIEVDGTLSFRTAPNANSFNSNLTVRVSLRDSGANSPAPNVNTSVEKTFSITVNAVNDPPIADNFVTTGAEDTALTIQSTAVLFGDVGGPTSDELGQTVTITQVERTSALGGTITPVFQNGVVTSMVYRPAANTVGIDTFLYVITDDGVPSRSGTGTITVVVGDVNDPPSFTKGADVTVLEDAGVVSIQNWATNILAGAPTSLDELANQKVSFVVVGVDFSMFEIQPTVSSTGTLSFKPARDAIGTSTWTIQAFDDGPSAPPNQNFSAVQTFNITLTPVNDAPVFTAGPTINVNEDSGAFSSTWATNIAPAAGLLSNPQTAVDEVNQLVDFIVTVDKPSLFTVQPTLTPAGLLSFTVAPDAFGQALVSVVARDRGPAGPNDQNTSVAKTLTIVIASVNDAPVGVPDTFTIDENTLLNVTAPGVLANDRDADLPNDQLKAVAATLTSTLGASVIIRQDGSFSYDPRSVTQLQRLTAGQSANDSFVYRVSDAAGLNSSPTTVTVVVTGVDDAPIAANDQFTVPVGQTTTLDVLANDSDIDTAIDPRTITITALPAFGNVSVSATGIVSFTPGLGFRGSDSFGYVVRDVAGNVSNEATVTVSVNTAPRAGNDTVATTRNAPIVINVLANDVDPDGTLVPSTVQIVSPPSPSGTANVLADGRISFTPANNFSGVATFTYLVKDNNGASSNTATVTVSVGSAWQNPQNNLDVNGDTVISPIDALIIINYINQGLPGVLTGTNTPRPPFIDPNGDENVSPFDALLIINYLNANPNGEGEASLTMGLPAAEGEGVQSLAAPIIVTMITPEQIVEVVGPQIVREIQSALHAELENAMAAAVDGELPAWSTTGGLEDGDDEGALAALADGLVRHKNRLFDTRGADDFFGGLI